MSRDTDLGPVVDARAFCGSSLFGWKVTPSALLRQMDALGIERSVLVPVKPRGYRFEPENARLSRLAAAHRDRFSAWCRVDPWQRDRALAELRRGLDEGAVGLYLDPLEELCPATSELVSPLVALAAERGRPTMVVGGHVRVSDAWQIGELARRHPDAVIIATSGGQINISGAALGEAETMLAEHPNVLMETSGIYREDFIEDQASRFGAGRILFGSGAPVYDRAHELDRIRLAHLAPEARRQMAAGTARRVFGL